MARPGRVSKQVTELRKKINDSMMAAKADLERARRDRVRMLAESDQALAVAQAKIDALENILPSLNIEAEDDDDGETDDQPLPEISSSARE